MKKVKVEELTLEAFLPFGSYANLIDPDAEKLGALPIEFFRDMVVQDLGGEQEMIAFDPVQPAGVDAAPLIQ